ncbi:MAG TPA: glycolate oxidase subunit GlcF [Rhizomicrobium sp.]|jgi:glycolate oxidase iron-sulfur subunit
MRTQFSEQQLADPCLADAEKSVRACVHCGICTATCPTYVLLGDERDSPRGRIVMMQAMLEEGGTPSDETVTHVDRCLSCLACRTACPSSVDYARLVDEARVHIEQHYRRPLAERLLRWLIATVMPRPALARAGIALARLFRPIARRLPGRLGVLTQMGMDTPPAGHTAHIVSSGTRRIALMPGCVQKAIAPHIDEAVARLLSRRDMQLISLAGAGCCGSLVHHLGREDEARSWAKRAIAAFEQAGGATAFEAILISATGCAAHLKDLAHLFLGDPDWLARAAAFAAKVKDFSELAEPRTGIPRKALRVAYHAACSAQNGLRLSGQSEALLAAAGFTVHAIPEGHLCCGSAGSYSILQPEIASALRARKLSNAARVAPDVIATGNIGCLNQLSGPDAPPVVHLAELIDWAEGGPMPIALARAGIAG